MALEVGYPVLTKGKVQLTLRDHLNHSIVLATYQRGDHFEDLAFMSDAARAVTATPLEETHLWSDPPCFAPCSRSTLNAIAACKGSTSSGCRNWSLS